MELRHLRYLIAVAEEGSFVAAASRLHIAQPALSRQIRDLETEIGTDVFLRGPAGVQLTAAGAQSVRAARAIICSTEEALRRARLADRGLVGKCVVGAGPYPIWNGLLGRVVEQARADYPGIEIVVDEYADDNHWQALAEARVDIGFGTAPPTDSMELAVETHSLDVMDAIVVARTHRLASRASVTLRELQPETWIRYAPAIEDEASRGLRGVLTRVGFVPAAKRQAGNASALRMLVRSGAGWAALPRSMRGALNTGLVAVPLEDLAIPFRYVHMHRRGDARPAVSSILRSLRRCARREGAGALGGEPPSGLRALAASNDAPNVSRLELRHFRYFAAIVQYQSIGRAAEALEITQPALSRQLRDLETEVGVTLFTRTSRGVVPTLAGEALHSDALGILRAADRMAAEALRALRGTAGDCVIGVVTSPLVWETVTRAVADCAARLPSVAVRLEDVPTPRQGPLMREARIDIGVGHRYPTAPDLDPNVVHEQLLPDTLNVALLSRQHPLAQRRNIVLRDLGEVPLLFMKRAFSPGFYDFIMSQFARAGYAARIEGEYDGLPTVWALAAQGLGWCLGSASQREFPPHGLVGVPIRDLDVPWGCELLYRRDEARPSILEVIGALRRAAADVEAGMASQENKYWSDVEISA